MFDNDILNQEPDLPPEGVDSAHLDKVLYSLMIELDRRQQWDLEPRLYVLLGGPQLTLRHVMDLGENAPNTLINLFNMGLLLPETTTDGEIVTGVGVLNEAWGTVVGPDGENPAAPGRIVDLPEDQRQEIRLFTVAFRNGSTGSIGHVRGEEPTTAVSYVPRSAARQTRVPDLMFRLLTGEPL